MRWRRRLIRLAIVLGVLLVLAATHRIWLPQIALLLESTDELKQADAIYVLDGGRGERVQHTVRLLNQRYAPVAYATKEAHRYLQLGLGDTLNPRELNDKFLRDTNLIYRRFKFVPAYLSTFEEMSAIMTHAREHGYQRVILVSNRFHTARMQYVAELVDWPDDIELIISGAKPLRWSHDNWWRREGGLIFVNNEYVKWVHYWLTYD